MTETPYPSDARPRDSIVQVGLFVIMEMAWIAALALFLSAAMGGVAPALPIVCVLYPLAIVVDGVIGRARPTPWAFRAIHAAVYCATVVALIFLVLPAGSRIVSPGDGALAWVVADPHGRSLAALVALSLFCWVRGAFVSGRALTAYAVSLGFQIGLVVLLGVLIFSSVFGIDWPGTAGLTFAFVLSGLLALWHLRASIGEGRGEKMTGRDPGAALVGLVIVLGLGLAVTAGLDRGVLDAIAVAVLRLVDWIMAAILYLISLFPTITLPGGELPERLEPPLPDRSSEPDPLFTPPEILRMLFAAMLLFLAGLATMVILFGNLQALLAWLRRRRDRTPGLDYDRSRNGLGDTLRDFWHALIGAFPAALRWLRTRLGSRHRRPSDHPIRRAYIRLERQLEARGWPRQPFETPFEYAARMKSEWPAPGADLAMLTRLYVNVRYGRPRHVDAGRLRSLLKKIRRSLEQVRYQEHNADTP